MSEKIKPTNAATEPKQMTLTVQSANELVLGIAGSGTVTIDWGGGMPRETHRLEEFDFIDYCCGGCGSVFHENEFTSFCMAYGYGNCEWKVKSDNNEQICTKKFVNKYKFRGHSAGTITITGEKITHLSFSSINLTNLDVGNNLELIWLECCENYLTSIDIRKNTALEFLNCQDNQLTHLDVSTNISLIELFCSDNLLTNLDVSKNTALECLNCKNNQLTHLDVSANTELTNLCCTNNQLTNLNLRNNTKLEFLNYNGNQFADVDISANELIYSLNGYMWLNPKKWRSIKERNVIYFPSEENDEEVCPF